MNLKLKLEKRIKEKEEEINILETQLIEAHAYLQAMYDTMRLLPKNEEITETVSKGVRAGSLIEQAYNALKEAGRPLQVMELLEAMGKEQSKKQRQSLVGSIGGYLRKGQIFQRVAPNTFGLIEWSQQNSAEIFHEKKLPEHFGL